MCFIQQRTTCYTTHSNIYLYMEYPSHDESRDQMDAIILIYIYIYIRVYTRFGQQRSIGGIRKYFRKSHQKSHASTNPPYYYHNYDDISINISVRTCLRATHSFDQMHGYAQCKYIHIIETIFSISIYIYIVSHVGLKPQIVIIVQSNACRKTHVPHMHHTFARV